MKRFLFSILIIFVFTNTSLAQEIGWTPSSGVSGEMFDNRIHYENYAKSGLSVLKNSDKKSKVIVYPLEVNKEVKKHLPNLEQVLVSKLLDSGLTLDNSLFTSSEIILDIKSFKTNAIIAFNIRLLVKSGSFLNDQEFESLIPETILWEDIQFGYVKRENADKIKDYIMACIDDLIKNINTPYK